MLHPQAEKWAKSPEFHALLRQVTTDCFVAKREGIESGEIQKALRDLNQILLDKLANMFVS